MLKKLLCWCLLFLFILPLPARANLSADVAEFEAKYPDIYGTIDPALAGKMEIFLQDVVEYVVDNYDADQSINVQIKNGVGSVLLTGDKYKNDLLPFMLEQAGNQDLYQAQLSEMQGIVRKEVQARINPTPPPVTPPATGGGGGGGALPAQPVIPPVATQPPPPTTGVITTANTAVITEQGIDKQVTTTPAGQTVETFTVKEEVKTEIAQAITAGKAFVQINITPTAQAAKTIIDIPASVMQSSSGLGLAITTPNATLEVPKALVDAFAKAGQELSITVAKGTAAESTAQMAGVPGTQGARVLGTPTVIHTDIQGSTAVTLPLTGIDIPTNPAAQASFLQSLAIFAVHSDGGKQVIAGTIVKDASGNPVGISFQVDKFSTFAIIQVAASTAIFSDTIGHWAAADIEKMVKLGLVSGISTTEFAPNRTITRAEFSALLVKALGIVPSIQISGRFYDVPANAWYFNVVNTAADSGLITGYTATTFGPNDPITREQIAVMISRALSYKGKNTGSYTRIVNMLQYEDLQYISSWAADSVAAVVEQEIMKGRSTTQFAPFENTTRAEAAVIILRMYNK